MNPLTQEWLDAAEEDLNAAQVLLAHGGLCGTVCFHCQQAAEKFLKAFLQEQGVTPPRMHDLPQLLAQCETHSPTLNVLRQAAQRLDIYYLPPRYPPVRPTLTGQEAQEAVTLAEQVRDTIKNALGITSSS
jgi:HEPN domain-containing protein